MSRSDEVRVSAWFYRNSLQCVEYGLLAQSHIYFKKYFKSMPKMVPWCRTTTTTAGTPDCVSTLPTIRLKMIISNNDDAV